MIEISGELLNRIRIHGEESYNEECCGALYGIEKNEIKIINDILEFQNEKTESKKNRYLITPGQYKQAEKQAEEKNLDLLGFYHSHPDHPALPSQFDTDHALPWFIYIIVSINNAKANNLTAWILKDDRSAFAQQEIFNSYKVTHNIVLKNNEVIFY
jgi:proteasome lid subunit RPN8/RPN11